MDEKAAVYLESNSDCSDYFFIRCITDVSGNSSSGLIKSPLETWHHLAVVYNSTTVSIHVNGALSSHTINMFASSTMNTIRERNFIGMGESSIFMGESSRFSSGYYFSNIVIDEIKLFNKALTLDQIILDMAASNGVASGIC
jgi:hypothetical protein